MSDDTYTVLAATHAKLMDLRAERDALAVEVEQLRERNRELEEAYAELRKFLPRKYHAAPGAAE